MALNRQAYQVFASWMTQTIRLFENENYIEVTYTVGPIPVSDGWGKEIVTVWRTGFLLLNLCW